MENLTNKTDAQLLGIIEGNLVSVLNYVDMPDYQKKWIKRALQASRQINYNR